ncbi:MAG: hypothetical protein NWQ39_08400 [Saprospiraceae bacterium]|nr:hypothetical protein [Saprospiraceae bacterium]MDP4914717.1 hypothetical protein [Saprospiraceae bacterium]MDP5048410.1 hypothetical protein [Saprospiraceae bacterium]MDP5088954.1 hypothetical protein [Saprospiraceae bacterium]
MKKLIFIICCFIPFMMFAQEELYQTTRDEFNYGEFRPNNSAPIYGIAEKPGKLMGNIYLDSIFRSSAVVFFKEIVKRYDPNASDSIAGYKLRINLLEKLVEFKMNGGIKGVDIKAIKKIQTFDPAGNTLKTYINGQSLGIDSVGEDHFYDLVYDGLFVKVVSLSVLKKKEPTYHVALSMGDKNAYYYLKTTYFAKIENGKWSEIQNNKNTWLDLTGSREKVMSSYLQQNQLNLKLTSDLRQFFQYFDKIMVE